MFKSAVFASRFAVLCLFVAALPAAVAAQESAATKFVQQRHQTLRRVLQSSSGPQRATELTNAMSSLIDYEELSKRSLEAHWNTRSKKERDEFVSLLRRFVERSYQHNIEQTLEYVVKFEGEEATADGTIVKTVARSRQNRRAPEVTVDYSLMRVGNAFRVFDITTDGVSMVRNYRNQFNRIIRRDGFAELLKRMRARVDSNDASSTI